MPDNSMCYNLSCIFSFKCYKSPKVNKSTQMWKTWGFYVPETCKEALSFSVETKVPLSAFKEANKS